VLRRQALAVEDVAQVAAARLAQDLDAAAVGVAVLLDGAGDLVVEAGPAAAGLELVGGAVQGRVAAAADVGPGGLVRGVLAGERALGPLAQDDALFLGIERVVALGIGHGASPPPTIKGT